MRKITSLLHRLLTFERFPYLTFLSNGVLGFAFGKIVVTPGDELPENLFIKALMMIGACLFWNYLMCLHKAGKGVTRNFNGQLRPILREAWSCAYLNGLVLAISMGVFVLKVRLS